MKIRPDAGVHRSPAGAAHAGALPRVPARAGGGVLGVRIPDPAGGRAGHRVPEPARGDAEGRRGKRRNWRARCAWKKRSRSK